MKITSVVLHSCIRAMKQAWLLMEHGHEVHMVSERVRPEMGWKDLDMVALIHTGHLEWNPTPDAYSIMRTCQVLDPITDVFHVHNEPDWIVDAIRRVTQKPIVWDIHDMVSQRSGEIDDMEKAAQEKCDAVVVPSAVYADLMKKRVDKPIEEILSCVPEKLMPKERRVPHRHGVVYEGGLKGVPKEKSEQFEFRSWADVFLKLTMMGIETWAYPSSITEDMSNYYTSGAVVMNPLPYDQLLKNLTAHEAGLVGSPFPNGAFNGALPNKLFEYIAAGLPIIVYNAPTARAFVDATGFGAGVDDLAEIPDLLEQFRKENIADFVWEYRTKWTMDRQIPRLLELYQKLCPSK